ncbi:AAA-like domain-containing protein [Desulfococcaceae bacterium HSG8]|nr:AAA-like domain-containing protein [Desulfococcaceae bacterium HSG8]
MRRKFNDTGLCVAPRHYMVDTSAKIEQILELIEEGEYFTINRPRQFGKTTTLSLLAKQLNLRDDYVALNISFEDIDSDTYQHQELFIVTFLEMLGREFEFLGLPEPANFLAQQRDQIPNMPRLSYSITTLVRDLFAGKSLVLLIDEVDKSSNNQLFLDFLAMLRKKYLQRNEGKDHTFQSVILAGVHDVKTLKAKIRPDDEKKYNSPWNIAMDFEVDLSFAPDEIETMLQDYSRDKGIQPDIPGIAEKLHYYTSGYPYLVSKLCKFIDEKIVTCRDNKDWTLSDVEAAFKMIADPGYTTTLFDSLIKNLENNPELYTLVSQVAINGNIFTFNISNPLMNLGYMYGILSRPESGHCHIHNRIFEQRIYDYMMSKLPQTDFYHVNGFGEPEFYTNEGLDVKLILKRFQTFMKEHYSNKDEAFLEREGRLLFLSYLRPIINGRGFEFKEPNVADERRMDIVITYRNIRYVLELKIWRGDKYHREGLKQLSDYLDTYSLGQGYLLIYDFRKSKEYKQEEIVFEDKQIFAVWV